MKALTKSYEKELTTALENFSFSNKITTHGNRENNSSFLKPEILDKIDSIRQKKNRPEVESSFDHIEKTGFLDIGKRSVERTILELKLTSHYVLYHLWSVHLSRRFF